MSVAAFGAGRLARGSWSSFFSQRVGGLSFSQYGRSSGFRPGIRPLTGKPSPPPSPKFEKVFRVAPKQRTKFQTMLSNFLGPKPMPERHTFAWYGEMLLICTVFAITGSSTMVLVSRFLEI